MADSSGSNAGFDDIPASPLTASHLAADHDVAARIAQGHNLLRRDVRDRAAVARLVMELTEWTARNRDLLAERFVDGRVAETYSNVAEPLVVPSDDDAVEVQIVLLHQQLRHQVEWLERLRLTIPEREQPPASGDEPHLGRKPASRRSVAVLATTASSFAAAVVGAVARATGILPVVVEDHPSDRRSLVRAAQETLPTDAIAVIVLEPPDEDPTRPTASSLLALGYAAGALGTEDVIAVSPAGMTLGRELADFATVVMERGDGWRRELESLLSDAGFTASPTVSSVRRS